ncbi:MAG: histidinol phosphate phosphatase domain-containing protein [Phycisphaerae bacterium]|nr:histidinol phosphate phosphatase domain-containing protein [Phycisphaerae bacterium]
MIDFHTHTFLSDGELGPAELVRRVEIRGFRAVGFADHVDNGTLEHTLPLLVRAARELSEAMTMKVLAGCELTHCRPQHIARLAARARELGAEVVICHGESPVEPVLAGTNRAAIEAGVDILAHPGMITEADAAEAARRGVLLEISGRRGHSLTNAHVAATALRVGAKLVFGSDAHAVSDFYDRAGAERVLLGAGLSAAQAAAAFANAETLSGLAV